MRLPQASLALVGLLGPALAHEGPVTRRKTMGFGPVHPHARFHTSPVSLPSASAFASDPYGLARSFVAGILRNQLSEANNFVLRKDSYADKATGLINGLEVADGDINVNVKDGVVISYGDSFYRGHVPSISLVDEPITPGPHVEFCDIFRDHLAERVSLIQQQSVVTDQIAMSGMTTPRDESLERMQHLHRWNCEHVLTPYEFAERGFIKPVPDNVVDARAALLQFIIAATPNDAVVAEIISNHDDIIDNMTSWFEAHFLGDESAVLVEMIDHVPDAVSPLPDGDKTVLVQAWRFEVEMRDNWYEAVVSRQAPHRILSVVDWASDSPIPSEPTQHPPATYNVYAFGINDPSEGNRSIQKEKHDRLASPLGWHVIPVANDPTSSNVKKKGSYSNYTTTIGNNVIAHENWDGHLNWLYNYRPDGGKHMIFNFPYNPKPTETTDSLDEAKKYINTTVTQLFYTSNLVHDLYYRYGFDEVSGNFQQHNFGRGGEEGDAVITNAQDGSGFNNANFMTPPDGQNGRCRMYLWNTANPYRDGDLEAGIVIHELTHGLSIRLTGGPANSGCLGWGESGGMGEGWGDFLATTIRSKAHYSDYPMGAWAANKGGGIRKYLYSVDKAVNPSTYKTLDKPDYWGVHAVGEVWAEMLWVVAQRLIAKHGFAESLFPPAPLEDGTIPLGDFYREPGSLSGARALLVPKHGNSLMVQLVLNAMKLQPCRPGFFEARSAIIESDRILTGGENFCELWLGFAEMGLGVDAEVVNRTPWGGGIRTNGFNVPDVCQPEKFPEPYPEPEPGEPDEDELEYDMLRAFAYIL
ncbi:extracellular elastinolytic metallo proteinase [Russula earlei]|uniref:Extracellular elastinolytic metallo proteinase n=1 Tax=Russula earlei TaxID=71964 RepID=A0ACC0U5J7_9AGAM|nr:extracellular elastinolytic metallo proteinase [Russula earlei]